MTGSRVRSAGPVPLRDRCLSALFPAVAAEWHPTKNQALGQTPDTLTPGSNRKVWWLCGTCGHEWETTPCVRTRGHGCAACAGMVATPNDNLTVHNPPWLAEWDYDRNTIAPTDVKLKSSAVKVWWRCPQNPDHSYDAAPSDRARGNGCSYCAGKRVDTTNSVAGRAPHLVGEWDHERNDRSPDEVAAGGDYRAHWVCSKDPEHRWQATVASRVTLGVGCNICGGKTPGDHNRFDLHAPAFLVSQWHPTRNGDLRPADVTIASGKRVWWQCRDCSHEWEVPVRSRTTPRFTGCPMCAPVIRSRIEINLACEFAYLFPDDTDPRQATVLDLGERKPHSVDILLSGPRIAIEYDGSATHNDPKRAAADIKKTRLLEARGYRVIRIRAASLPPLDPDIEVVTETDARTVKPTVDAVLDRILNLGWASTPHADSYLHAPAPLATALADDIYALLPTEARFVPYSAKAARKRKAENAHGQPPVVGE